MFREKRLNQVKKMVQEKKPGNQKAKAGAIIIVAVALLVSYFAVFGKIDVMQSIYPLILEYGLLGLFLGAIIANATLFLVVPVDLIVFGLGGIYTPFVLAVVVGLGAAIGELSAYLVGVGGNKALKHLSQKESLRMELIKDYLKNYGMLFVCIGAFTPFPFDLIGIAAGLIRYSIPKFFVAALIGKFFRYFVIAYAGMLGISLIKSFFGL